MNLSSAVLMPLGGSGQQWSLRPGLILTGAGQCIETIHAMEKMLGIDRKPALIALYESISAGKYSKSADVFEAHTLFPGAILQIGLQLPLFDDDGMIALGSGMWEDQVMSMAKVYRKIGLPILLRIGYEFDGEKWNGYAPEPYIQAYCYIANLLKIAGANNVALVWDSYTVDNDRVADWFPGDDMVDWYGYNTLAPRFEHDNPMAARAQKANKPVMNGEASYAQGVGDMPFAEWIHGYFASIRATGTSAFQYINWRWSLYPKAAGWHDWADGRITDDNQKSTQYIQAMDGEDMVYRDASYARSLMLSIDCARAMAEGSENACWQRTLDHSTAYDGFDYSVRNVTCSYQNGWSTAWLVQKQATVHIQTPAALIGEVLIKPAADDLVVLVVNHLTTVWKSGCGYIHIPVRHGGGSHLTIARADGQPFALSHIFVIQNAKAEPLNPLREGNVIRWQKAARALYYHLYRDYALFDIVSDCTYTTDLKGHAWHVAAYFDHDGISAMEEVQ